MGQMQTIIKPEPVLRRRSADAAAGSRRWALVRAIGIGCGLAVLTLLAGWLFAPSERSVPAGGSAMTLESMKSAEPLRIAGLFNPDDPEAMAAMRQRTGTEAPGTDSTGSAPPEQPATAEAVAPDAALAQIAPASGGAGTAPVTATPLGAPLASAAGPSLALVLTEAGENQAATRAAITRLPESISLGFTPYAADARRLAALAREDGHDVLIGLPMQPKSYPSVSPGAQTLLVGQSPAQLQARLDWALGRIEAVDGVYTMMGSAFTTSRADYQALLAQLKARQLMVVDARSIGSTLGPALAAPMGVRLHLNSSFVEGGTAQVRQTLGDLAARAKREGKAIGFIRATPEMVATLEAWLPEAERAGVRLVAVSAL